MPGNGLTQVASAADVKLAIVHRGRWIVGGSSGSSIVRAVRSALTGQLRLPVSDEQWTYLAPEALLSRLQTRRVDVDAELRRMLSGGSPNALHSACRRSPAVNLSGLRTSTS